MNDRRDEQIAKDGEVAKRDAIIQSLKKRLRKEERHGRTLAKRVERIRTFAELSVDGAALPVKVLEALTKEGLRRFMDDTGISEGDVIYVQRTGGWGRSVVRDLADLRIRALITPSVGESDPQILVTFQEAGIPLLAGTNTGVQVRGRQGLAPKDRFEAALRLWQEEQVQFLRERESSRIEHMFKEYKSERGKEVRKGGADHG
jgi:predicted RNase H-like nuclease (RuvC/YqgF family)